MKNETINGDVGVGNSSSLAISDILKVYGEFYTRVC